ncbi:unnamed protein product [Hydatigera taeniaeformis]|uniref:PHM7_ext domain-containing protein n=1 Tax=Hydatigena taeniaeformis TaxID=6205 RepID=A0A0R3WYQ5_HYDTA|nr:unnamed protein product [Hydatigera taeniaeformis]
MPLQLRIYCVNTDTVYFLLTITANDVVANWYQEASRFKYGREPVSIQGIAHKLAVIPVAANICSLFLLLFGGPLTSPPFFVFGGGGGVQEGGMRRQKAAQQKRTCRIHACGVALLRYHGVPTHFSPPVHEAHFLTKNYDALQRCLSFTDFTVKAAVSSTDRH